MGHQGHVAVSAAAVPGMGPQASVSPGAASSWEKVAGPCLLSLPPCHSLQSFCPPHVVPRGNQPLRDSAHVPHSWALIGFPELSGDVFVMGVDLAYGRRG